MALQTFALWVMFVSAGVLILMLLPYVVSFAMQMVMAFGRSLDGNWQEVKTKDIERQVRRQVEHQVRQQQPSGSRPSPFRREIPNHDVYASLEVLKSTMKHCCELHHFSGEVLGVTHLGELKDHMICGAHRTRVLDTTDYVLNLIAAKDVISDPVLEKMAVGLDATRDTCADCMLLQFDRLQAPILCTPAKFLGCQDEPRESGAAK